jgi:hypothetical protein
VICRHQAAASNKYAKSKEVNEENEADYNAERIVNAMPETLRKKPLGKKR